MSASALKYVVALFSLLSVASLVAAEPVAQDKTTLIIVVGAPGEAEFGASFNQWADLWEKAGTRAGAKLVRIGSVSGTVFERVAQGSLPEVSAPAEPPHDSKQGSLTDRERL